MNLTFVTQILAKSYEYLPSCHSTNDIMLDKLRSGTHLEDGYLVFTFDQTKGRGQRGNVWEAVPHKNLTFTLLLKPDCRVMEQFNLNVMVCIALQEALQELTPHPVKVKWPNDIYVLDGSWKKLGGILIENRISEGLVKSSVVGIGINVNQETFEVPNATSLKLVTSAAFDLPELMNRIFVKLEAYYLQNAQKWNDLLERYVKNLLFYGKKHKFEDASGFFEAEVQGIDASGALLLKVADATRKYEVKEVRFVF